MSTFHRLAFEAGIWSAAAAGTYNVGYSIIDVDVGGSPIAVAVWYPTDSATAPILYGTSEVPGEAAVDAPVKGGQWPLVMFSHGFSGSGTGTAPILERIAAAGYVVAAPDHSDAVVGVRISGELTGDVEDALNELGNTPPSLETHGYRIDEARAVIDAMLGSAQFQAHPTKVALVGHSMGGWTCINTALIDPRPRALVSFSMGELHWLFTSQRFFTSSEMTGIMIPAFWMYGTNELALVGERTPVNAQYSHRYTRTSSCLVSINGGGHFVYVDQAVASNGGNDTQLGLIALAAIAFLNRKIKGRSVSLIADECHGPAYWTPFQVRKADDSGWEQFQVRKADDSGWENFQTLTYDSVAA